MRLRVKNKENVLFVRVRLPMGSEIDKQELDFFSRKYFRGFLKPKKVRGNLIVFSGPVAISLSERLEEPIGKNDFFFIIEQIVDAVQKLLANQLSCQKVVWNTKSVFINKATKELQFLYLPLKSTEQTGESALSFVENIAYSSKPSGERDTDSVSRFSYYLRDLKEFNPEKVEKYIKKEAPSVVATIKRHRTDSSITDKQMDYFMRKEKLPEDYVCTDLLDDEEATALLKENQEEETDVLEQEDEEATGLLNESEQEDNTALLIENLTQYPTLIRVRTEESISVNRPVFRIGKEKGRVDYCVADNNAVSRCHAAIVTRGARYYLQDQGSKNKTYINGRVIPSNLETEITDGDHLRFGNEEFIFNA